MGFLDGLTTLLGGFSDVKQIDKEGFDFREKRAQDQFLRDRQRQLASQQDEDRAVEQIADVLATQEGEPDTSMIPQQVLGADKAWRVQRAMGRLPERKSAIEGMKASAAYNKQLLSGDQAMQREQFKGEMRSQLMQQAEEIRQNQTMSPREKESALMKLDAQLQLFERAEAGRNARSAASLGRPQRVQTKDAEGNAVWGWITPGQEGVPLAPTAVERQGAGVGLTITDSLKRMEDAMNAGVVSGPVIGSISKKKQQYFPSGNEADFDFQARALVDLVYLKSGKQINQQEQATLAQMIPDRARGDLPGQMRRFKDYVGGLMRKYKIQDEAAPAPGGPPRIGSEQDYNALPPGAEYIDPNGVRRRKGVR